MTSLDLNVPSESLSVTVLGREFQVARAEQRNARFISHRSVICVCCWQILEMLSEVTIAIRTKALKCLAAVIEVDPTVLAWVSCCKLELLWPVG